MKQIFMALLCFVLFISCTKIIDIIEPPQSSDKVLHSFALVFGCDTLNMSILDSTIEGIKADTAGMDSCVALFTFVGKKMLVNGVEQLSGITKANLKEPVYYLIEAEDGSFRSYKLKLRKFTGLPILYITSPPVSSKDDYVDGQVEIDGNTDFLNGSYKMQIRGRGNSTWGQLKNPYKIKLSNKASLLGMPSDKEWALLANYYDKSGGLRSAAGFRLAELIGLPWTPRRNFVQVFQNGDYLGMYLLIETIKVAEDRLNISVMKADTTGSFLLEADWGMDAPIAWATASGVRFSLKEPETANETQEVYIKNLMQGIEDDVSNYQDVRAKINIDSWIRWVIVNEVMLNHEAMLHSSSYFYKGKDERMEAGPVWDFDMSAGAWVGTNNPNAWLVNTANIIGGLFQYHDYYKQRFKEIWNLEKSKIKSIVPYIGAQYKILKPSIEQNSTKYAFATPTFSGQLLSATQDAEVERLKTIIMRRIAWIDKELN